MEQQPKQSAATVEEVESRSSHCSPVVCILSVCLCLLLVALIVVTALHTHTKLQAAGDDDGSGPNPAGCPLIPGQTTGLRGPCQALQSRVFPATVGTGGGGGGGGGACADWYGYACPAAGFSTQANVTYSQLVLLGLAQSACPRGPGSVDSVLQDFYSVTNVRKELVTPVFKC